MAKTNNSYTFTTDDLNLATDIMKMMRGEYPAQQGAMTGSAPVQTVGLESSPNTSAPPAPAVPVAPPPAAVAPPPVAAPPPTPAVPKGDPAPGWTIEHPRSALAALAGVKGPAAVATVLQKFNTASISDANPADWHLIHAAATEAAA